MRNVFFFFSVLFVSQSLFAQVATYISETQTQLEFAERRNEPSAIKAWQKVHQRIQDRQIIQRAIQKINEALPQYDLTFISWVHRPEVNFQVGKTPNSSSFGIQFSYKVRRESGKEIWINSLADYQIKWYSNGTRDFLTFPSGIFPGVLKPQQTTTSPQPPQDDDVFFCIPEDLECNSQF